MQPKKTGMTMLEKAMKPRKKRMPAARGNDFAPAYNKMRANKK